MKKYLLLIISFVNLLVSFICFWYGDVLLNRFFVFGIIPHFICVISLLSSVVISIVFIIRHRLIIRNYVSLAISMIAISLLFVFPFRMAKLYLELTLFEEDRIEIIEMVRCGEISTDNLGNAKLPKGYGHLSSDGEIFIYQNDNEQVISFWVFRGILSGSIQLIYSSTDESLIYANETGHPITDIQELKEHWYLVDTDY